MPGVVADSSVEAGKKKSKKLKQMSNDGYDGDGVEIEKKRKRNKEVVGDPENSNSVEANGVAKEKSLKKKRVDSTAEDPSPKRIKLSASDEEENGDGDEAENPYALSNFRISDTTKKKLNENGIKALFAIQALTFDAVYDGQDLVGRAKTGQGKTLAFVLPIVERLANSQQGQRKMHGRAPSVLVLVPTRELAKQVHADFETYGSVIGLSTLCVYGGSPYGPQEGGLRRGVDVVVGTPGRIKDLLEKGTLNLKTIKFRVLDEADEMLNMGFVDHVELILGHIEDLSAVQTLLFSATMPDWVKNIASRFFKPNKATVDLVGDDKMKASASVKHLILPCIYQARNQIVADVITFYGSGRRTIVFTETKNDASELAGVLGNNVARALHGDIPQAQRETTLAGFRSGKFSVLVATDVAARGLDINEVELIIQCQPPRDVETYIHRSGRTGRAGKTGIAVMMYDRKKEYMIPMIEKKAGLKFQRVSAPQPADLAQASASSAAEGVEGVSDSVIPLFRQAAEDLVQSIGLPTMDVLAKALAKIAGHTDVKRRSLLTSHEDSTTLLLKCSRSMYSPTYVFNILRKHLEEATISQVRRMSLTVDGMGAIFDVPAELVDKFVSVTDSEVTIEIADMLPELQVRPQDNSFGSHGGGRGASFGRGGGGGGFRFGQQNGRQGSSGFGARGGRGWGGGRGQKRW